MSADKIHVSMSSEKAVTVSGFTGIASSIFQGAMMGNGWVQVSEGKLHFRAAYEELPDPISDEKMLPFWSPFNPELQKNVQHELFVFDEKRISQAPSYGHITITDLCGHYYTPENYKREAKKLIDYGFVQMRSQRDDGGRFQEQWYLPGVWAIKGELKEVIKTLRDRLVSINQNARDDIERICFEEVIEFLRKNVSFGSMDISVQRLAMPAPD